MTVPAWSHSRLEAFENCPRQFYEVQVAKNIQEAPSSQMIWGNQVHKDFELYLKGEQPLPDALILHQDFLDDIRTRPGKTLVENKIALNRQLEPCGFFDGDVWYRGIIDAGNISGTHAWLVDHKTGKQHSKFAQLKLFALWCFHSLPWIQTVRADFYWTQGLCTTGQDYHREQMGALWAEFVPKLQRYKQAFQEDTWNPRQSGLCNGWCPVTECEYWSPKKKR